MTDLTKLKCRLARLRRRRTLAAWTRAIALFLGVLLWSLIGAFLLDVTLKMRLIERGLVLAVWSGFVLWAYWRLLLPVLRRKSSEIELSLMVESQQGIPSELVAALQFDDPSRTQYGLESLRLAVIADTAELSGGIEIPSGYQWQDFRRPFAVLVTSLALVAIALVLCSEHVEAFARRFVLSNASYPTRTQIKVTSPSENVGFGQPVLFTIEASGFLPEEGTVAIAARETEERTFVTLTPDPTKPDRYTGQLDRAIDSFSYTVELGDAPPVTRSVHVMPLPKVNVELKVATPEYAVERLKTLNGRNGHNAALEGSRVEAIVTADKPLRSATFEVNGKTFAMKKHGKTFVLESADPMLARLSEPLRYQVQVKDKDGLKLDRPAGGVLRVLPDRAPIVGCSSTTIQILPSATPTVRVSASDDFGIERMVLRGSVIRHAGGDEQQESEPQTLKQIEEAGRQIDTSVQLDLAALDLEIGDRLICVAQVVDHRGELPGRTATCPPLIFEIVDRETVLMNLREIGARMDGRLGDIIKTQGDMGEQ